MQVPSNPDDYITTFDDEDKDGTPYAIAQCECGVTWAVRVRGKYRYTSDEWWEEIVKHFKYVHDQMIKDSQGEEVES